MNQKTFLLSFIKLTSFCVFFLMSANSWSCDLQTNSASYKGPNIVIYTTSWCKHCQSTKQLLSSLKVNYTNCDIEQSPAARKKYEELDGYGVPLIMINQTRINGFEPTQIENAIKAETKS